MENIQFTLMGGTLDDEACSLIGLKHCLHHSIEKGRCEELTSILKIEPSF
ncbi:MAG TPA: hypothetical protein VLA74_10100 [Nitrososphaeraceae archaeon]|nr:hypothetical protein [Nitrososphaeraceae archaeon]